MAAKKVGFKPKPQNKQSGDLDKWVSDRTAPAKADRELDEQSPNVGETKAQKKAPHTADASTPTETKPKMKRLTIDVSEELHRAIKMKAVEQGTPMADMLRSLLENNYL